MISRWIPAGTLALLALLAPDLAHAQSAPRTPQERVTERVAREFYDAYQKADLATMARLYAPDVSFQDEIFSYSDRDGTMGMWAVLAPQAKVTWELLEVRGNTAKVLWKADYVLIGRPVHNEITATLTIEDGQIVRHRDAFSWARWSRQALPLGGIPTWRPAEQAIKFALRTFVNHQAKKAWPPRSRGMSNALGQ